MGVLQPGRSGGCQHPNAPRPSCRCDADLGFKILGAIKHELRHLARDIVNECILETA